MRLFHDRAALRLRLRLGTLAALVLLLALAPAAAAVVGRRPRQAPVGWVVNLHQGRSTPLRARARVVSMAAGGAGAKPRSVLT